ncbi:MAG: hypothetical protein FJ147_17820 [Deltaproteobacteria bacterium]|nr:hypothetical protein [Deltaproteobacteria bacterium]
MSIQDSLSIAIPCRASEPGLRQTLESLYEACSHTQLPPGSISELLVCINGIRSGEACAPLQAVREFCQQHKIECEEVWIAHQRVEKEAEKRRPEKGMGESERGRTGDHPSHSFFFPDSPIPRFPDSFPRCTVLLTDQKGKPPAWNTLWHWATGTMVLFSDADVRIDGDAVYALSLRMQQDATLNLVAAREVPFLPNGGTLWSRIGAIPYRFDFGNAGGRLLLLRKAVLPNGIPEDLLLEDAWLTVAVGKAHVAKEWNARVCFVPPTTWRDYFAERVRTEGGKLQIQREHGQLLAAGPIAEYRWSQFWQKISPSEYPLVALSTVIKGVARLWARVALLRKDSYSLYHPFSSTKEWKGQVE